MSTIAGVNLSAIADPSNHGMHQPLYECGERLRTTYGVSEADGLFNFMPGAIIELPDGSLVRPLLFGTLGQFVNNASDFKAPVLQVETQRSANDDIFVVNFVVPKAAPMAIVEGDIFDRVGNETVLYEFAVNDTDHFLSRLGLLRDILPSIPDHIADSGPAGISKSSTNLSEQGRSMFAALEGAAAS